MKPLASSHTTEQEIQFLNNLGRYTLKPLPRKELLLGYQAAMSKRTDWCGMARNEIGRHVERLLRSEELHRKIS